MHGMPCDSNVDRQCSVATNDTFGKVVRALYPPAAALYVAATPPEPVGGVVPDGVPITAEIVAAVGIARAAASAAESVVACNSRDEYTAWP